MLRDKEFGYACMTKNLTGISIEDVNPEVCKKYCYSDHVVVERIPIIIGVYLKIHFYNFSKPIRFSRYGHSNILWLHLYYGFDYGHKTGKVIYEGRATCV